MGAPTAQPQARGLRHHDLRRDVGAGRRHRRGQPRAGLPRHRRPREVLDAAVAAMRSGQNQYPPGPGIADLRHAIADHQRRFYGLEVDPDSEVFVTTGATEAIAASLLGAPRAGRRGGRLRAVLRLVRGVHRHGRGRAAAGDAAGAGLRARPRRAAPGRHASDPAASSSTRRTTRSARCSRRADLDAIAAVAIEHDLLVIADEVYEHLVFDGAPPAHRDAARACASAPSPSRRRARRSRSPGWKVGWVCAPPELVAAVRTAKQFLTYVSGAPFQPAVAVGLRLPDAYFEEFTDDLRTKRDRLCAGLEEAGFRVFRPAGHLLHHDRHPAARRARRPGVLPLAAGAVRRGGRAQRRVLRRQGRRGRRSCASPSASATR